MLHETPGRRAQDEIEESDGEGDLDLPLADSPSTPVPPAPGQWSGQTPGQCSTPMPASTSGGAKTSLALAPPPSRSALVSGLQLSEAHLGEALDASARRTGSRRAGLFGACVARAQADQETKVITARHGILRPSLASADAVRAALADPSLQRLRLRLRRVLAQVTRSLVWPASISAAQTADWPRPAEACGSLRYALAPKAAAGGARWPRSVLPCFECRCSLRRRSSTWNAT